MSQSTSACECSVDDLSDCTGAPPSYCGTSVVSASSGASPPAAAFTAVQEVDRGAPQELELPDTDDDGFDDGARVMRRRSAQRRDAQTRQPALWPLPHACSRQPPELAAGGPRVAPMPSTPVAAQSLDLLSEGRGTAIPVVPAPAGTRQTRTAL